MNTSLIHPLTDPDFAHEAQGSREHILRWWDIVTEIAQASHVTHAFKAAELSCGRDEKTVCYIYYRWLKSEGDWRQLANRAKWPDPADATLPPAFISWLKNLHEEHQRDTTFEQTYRDLMAALTLWERDPLNGKLAIPGYAAPPRRNPFKGFPYGWGKTNLRKRCKSNAYEKALRRQGPRRASEFLPSVRTSREELEFGEIIYFDDQDHDTNVNLTGRNEKAMRPQSFDALEALSGCAFETGLKPQLLESGPDGRMATGTRRELNQLDFFWFVMLVLTKHGYNPKSGTTLVWEHAKANPDKTGRFDEMLCQATKGAIQVDKSGIWRRPAFKGMLFEGKPTGNFRFKAPIESFFNLFRNYASALPAPTGLNPDMAPEEMGDATVPRSLLGENARLLRLIDQIPATQFLRLKRPVLEWEDYCRIHRLIMSAINARRDHSLQGWAKRGFTGARYRLELDDSKWMDESVYQSIPAELRIGYDKIVAQKGYNQTFQLNPIEVFTAHRPQLTRLPMRLVPVLAPERAWEDVTVSQSLEMTIEDQWLDSEPLIFLGKVRTPQGYEVHLERGKTYKRLLNFFDPTKLWIAEADRSRKGALIGTATRVHTPCKVDHEAILAQLGEHNHVKAAESLEVHQRMQSEAARRIAARKFNRRIEENGAATIEDRAAARKKRSAARFGEILREQSQQDPPASLGEALRAGAAEVAGAEQTQSEENIESW